MSQHITCAQCGETFDSRSDHICRATREKVAAAAESPLGLFELIARVTGLEDRSTYAQGFMSGMDARAYEIEAELRNLAQRCETLDATVQTLRSDYLTALRRIEALTALVSRLERGS